MADIQVFYTAGKDNITDPEFEFMTFPGGESHVKLHKNLKPSDFSPGKWIKLNPYTPTASENIK